MFVISGFCADTVKPVVNPLQQWDMKFYAAAVEFLSMVLSQFDVEFSMEVST